MNMNAWINDKNLGRITGIVLWLLLLAVLLDPPEFVDLQNAPVLLLLASTVYSLFLPLFWSLLLSAIAVLVLNYEMVPPIKTFSVDLRAHGILLITITLVSWILSYLLRRQREFALKEHQQTVRTLQLMRWSEALRAADDPQSLLPNLYNMLREGLPNTHVVLGFQQATYPMEARLSSLQLEGFLASLTDNLAFGPGTGRHENQRDLYLPFRGKSKAFGVAVVMQSGHRQLEQAELAHAQALCDQMGLACERKEHAARAEKAREQVSMEETRNVFLSAIAHDQRTPLASIITSASSMIEQIELLSPEQLKGQAQLIVSEANQMNRLIDNTLSLARLSGHGVVIQFEPETAEDVVSAVFQRLRARKSDSIPQVEIERDLPFVSCNLVFMEQALDNLIDNAMKHSGKPDQIQVRAYQENSTLVFEVRDHGNGMPAQSRPTPDGKRGAGIGLRLCETVARLHQGQLCIDSTPGMGTIAKLKVPGIVR